jgi:hypothetical protein
MNDTPFPVLQLSGSAAAILRALKSELDLAEDMNGNLFLSGFYDGLVSGESIWVEVSRD